MAIVATPSALKIRSIQWTLFRPSQVNRSAWTGRRQVFGTPGHSRWSAELDLAPLVGADVPAMRMFLVQLRGQINTFRLSAVEAAQTPSYTNALAAAASAGSTSVSVDGWPTRSFGFRTGGQFITINDQLLMLTSVGVSDLNGVATLTFEPPLRAAAALGTAVETNNPTALVALAEPSVGWDTGLGAIYGFSLTVEEAF